MFDDDGSPSNEDYVILVHITSPQENNTDRERQNVSDDTARVAAVVSHHVRNATIHDVKVGDSRKNPAEGRDAEF